MTIKEKMNAPAYMIYMGLKYRGPPSSDSGAMDPASRVAQIKKVVVFMAYFLLSDH